MRVQVYREPSKMLNIMLSEKTTTSSSLSNRFLKPSILVLNFKKNEYNRLNSRVILRVLAWS
jgi:hypothetical protein